jgi:PIN domain nuclease of toxin-antitoxin system
VRLLLDTHSFIWWDGSSRRLSDAARDAILDDRNEVLVSICSVWELQIKLQLGKLNLRESLREIVAHQRIENGFTLLPVTEEHVYALDVLPPIHRDPFDRLLAAQAIVEGASLVTADPVFRSYPVPVLW